MPKEHSLCPLAAHGPTKSMWAQSVAMESGAYQPLPGPGAPSSCKNILKLCSEGN